MQISVHKSQKIGTLEFESPINLEGSWGARTIADKAKSVMELYFRTDDASGWIEWEVEAHDLFEEIGLTFEIDANGKRKLVDYDGVMTLPRQAMTLLEQHGVDCSEMRESLDEPAEEPVANAAVTRAGDVRDYLRMSAEELHREMIIQIESGGEEENAERAAYYRERADVIDALGKFLHGARWAELAAEA